MLTVEVSEVDGGKILAAEKVAGVPGEDIFAVVDKLSANIKKSLVPAQQVQAESEKALADVTTHSPEAYRYYVEGWEQINKFYVREARQNSKKLLRLIRHLPWHIMEWQLP